MNSDPAAGPGTRGRATRPSGRLARGWWNTGRGWALLVVAGIVLVAALWWDFEFFLAAKAGTVPSSGPTSAVDTYGLGLVALIGGLSVYLAVLLAAWRYSSVDG